MRENVFLRDLALPQIDPTDQRKVEIVVTGLPLAHGLPVVVDATQISVLHADGTPWARADRAPGVCFARARRDKETTYPELVGSPFVHLVVAGMEVGGRLSREALDLLDAAAKHEARLEPRVLRRYAERAWRERWVAMLAVAGQDAVAATLVQEGVALLDGIDGAPPTDVWLDA